MNEIVPFAYERTGQVIAIGDGPELLIYSGANDQGMWKVMATDILMGVGYTKDHVHAVDGAGVLHYYRLLDGLEQSQVATGASPWGLAVGATGASAVVTVRSVVLVPRGGNPTAILLEGARCAAFDAAGGQVAVGCADGSVYVLDATTGAVTASARFPDPVTGVAWRAMGQWAVAHGQQIDLCEPAGLTPQKSLMVGAPVRRFALSEDGGLAAVQVADGLVRIFELVGDLSVGEVEFQRTLSGLAFGPGTWLAFGFDDGDANRLDVLTGKMTRTQAHVGRGQNAWAMNVRVNHAQVRGVVVGMAAGGKDIARRNVPKIAKKPKKWFWWAVGGAIGFVLLSLCCGAVGSFGLYTFW